MTPIQRKEIRYLLNDESARESLFDAINLLKSNGIYDKFTRWHYSAMMSHAGTDFSMSRRNFAHYSPVFLPWHREYLNRFEKALRDIDNSISLPYWDWTNDAQLQDPSKSEVWDLLGSHNPSENNRVTDGPFKNWEITINTQSSTPINDYLRRDFNNREQLPFREDVISLINSKPDYDKFPWDQEQMAPYSFRFQLEIPIHNPVHRWVGGTMMERFSPGDPVFFFHHCNIDRIWSNWQKKHKFLNEYPLENQITDRNNAIIENTNRNQKMSPWNDLHDDSNKTVSEVLDFTPLYDYDAYYVAI